MKSNLQNQTLKFRSSSLQRVDKHFPVALVFGLSNWEVFRQVFVAFLEKLNFIQVIKNLVLPRQNISQFQMGLDCE